jgi:hypothetical protein
MLALSGDYPVMGHRGLAAPVFDIDSVGLISLFFDMNAGLRWRGRVPGPARSSVATTTRSVTTQSAIRDTSAVRLA